MVLRGHGKIQRKERSEELKRSLITGPVLHMPDFNRPFVVTTDANAVSVGGILEQDFEQGL